MATNKQICKIAGELDEAAEQLQVLKDRKQTLQDQLADMNQRITDQQVLVFNALTALKTLVNE